MGKCGAEMGRKVQKKRAVLDEPPFLRYAVSKPLPHARQEPVEVSERAPGETDSPEDFSTAYSWYTIRIPVEQLQYSTLPG
jgi:hypothetical protein